MDARLKAGIKKYLHRVGYIITEAMSVRHSFVLQSDHFQFYLEDRAIPHDTGELWDCHDDPLLQTLDGLLAVGTARWGRNTPVTVVIHQQRPPDCEDGVCETVREGNLRTISGWLHLTTPEGDDAYAPSFPLPAGEYVARVCYTHLSQVEDEFDDGPDTYTIHLWRAR